MNNYDVTEDQKVKLAIGLKHNQLQREMLKNLEIEDFWTYLYQYKWKKNQPKNRRKAITQVMQTQASDIVAFLSRQAIVESANHSISDYQDLFKED